MTVSLTWSPPCPDHDNVPRESGCPGGQACATAGHPPATGAGRSRQPSAPPAAGTTPVLATSEYHRALSFGIRRCVP
jgi:hypothetical protein